MNEFNIRSCIRYSSTYFRDWQFIVNFELVIIVFNKAVIDVVAVIDDVAVVDASVVTAVRHERVVFQCRKATCCSASRTKSMISESSGILSGSLRCRTESSGSGRSV